MREKRWLHVFRFTLSALLAAVAAVAGPSTAYADQGTPPARATAATQTPSQRAAASGEAVEVVGARTEYTTTYANPDGMTYTLDDSAVPVRVRDATGSWVTPDSTLHRRTDGTVTPTATMADLVFSGGGSSAPLVTIGSADRSMSLTWPGALPTPTTEGDTAVYADVLPGVDLRLRATVDGFRELLVVKTPAAAADPNLSRIEFGLATAGVHMATTAGGGMAAVDDDGRKVFVAPPARMWDSASTGAAPQTRPSTTEGAGASRASTEDGPTPGGTAVTVPIDVDGTSLAIEPDPGMLAQTDPDAYPLYIDPDPIAVNPSSAERTLLRNDGVADYGWDNTDQAGGQQGKGDGLCGSWNGYYCGPGYVQRLYFQFTPAALKGKHVLSATFRITSPWAFQCQDRTSDLVRTDNFTSSTTWSSRPKELDWMGDRLFSAGRGSSCDPDSPAAPIEFTDNPAEPDENLTPTLQDFAAGKFAKLTLELRAHDEGDASAWKRFKNDATLSVTYIPVPTQPTLAGVKNGTSVRCETNASDPDVIGNPQPLLGATVRVASGSTTVDNHASLRAELLLQQSTGGAWSAVEDFVRPEPDDGFAIENQAVADLSPAVLSEGVLYRFAAFTWSYADNGTTHIDSPSTVTTAGWCYFTVDKTAPKEPVITFDGPYSECLPNSCPAQGGPGVPGSVTFTHAAADVNVTHLQYKLSTDAQWRAPISGSSATVTLVPPLSGTVQLQVRAQDGVAGGRWGYTATTQFNVAMGAGPVRDWHFDDALTSTTAADSLSPGDSGRRATLHTAEPAGRSWDGAGTTTVPCG
ncbi:hypothetical protein VSR01_13340 [Actinacidiphila sp. DG2A-62]|uniref:hypothetical protein n=1 Tax=Actinacidiphila sp. DG2A-62 TaxID=3108821 RepID=UPI002DB82038|nr:hypothetical protein [Actinacidiphila sp. DG2A-62]MEC3994460.1 hypothetical protein [Actinacidiphila sp. DG2A-62]